MATVNTKGVAVIVMQITINGRLQNENQNYPAPIGGEMFYQIVLPLGIPSKKNSKRIFTNRATGKPFITSSSAYHTWQKKTKPLMMRPLMSPFIECIVTIEVNDTGKRKYDLSNKAESILDCLVDANVLQDDNRFIVRELRLIGTADKAKEQGFLITIEGVGK